MKIVLVAHHFAEYGIELAEALAKEHEVHLVLSPDRIAQTIGDDLKKPDNPSLTYAFMPESSGRILNFIRTVLFYLKLLRRVDPDIVHIQEPLNYKLLAFLCLTRRPKVLTVHDVLIHPGNDADTVKGWQVWVMGKIRRHLASGIILHGRSLKRLFMKVYGRNPDDLFVVPIGSLFSFVPDDSVPPPEEEPHTVLFFGRIEAYKGLKYLIESEPRVSERISDYKIIVAGRGEDLDRLKPRIAGNPRFEIHDRFLPNEEVALYFQRSSVVVLPYLEASQSGVTPMAFAFGKPVIVTDVGSLSEMVENDVTGIVLPPRDVDALTAAIMKLLSDGEERRRLGQNAARAAREDLSWNRAASLTIEAYRRTIADRR